MPKQTISTHFSYRQGVSKAGTVSTNKARSAQTDKQCQFSYRQAVSKAGTSSVHKQGKKCPNRQQCQFSYRQEVSKAGMSSVHKQGKKCPNRQKCQFSYRQEVSQAGTSSCPQRQEVPKHKSVNSATDKQSTNKARSAQTDKQCQFSYRQAVSKAGTSSVHKQGKKCPNRQAVSIQLQTSSVKGWDEQRPQTRQEVPKQTSSVNSATDKQCPRLGQVERWMGST